MRAADAFRSQARGCAELGSPMYAELLDRLADDIEAGGPTAEVLAGHEDDPGPSALALRLAGSVHRLVLERRAGAAAAYFPSVGGTWEPDGGTAAVLELLAREPALVREWLDRPPQTNEVGRAAALYGGLLHLPDDWRTVRVHEVGASGGLNLLAGHFSYASSGGRVRGARHSPVVLDPAWSSEPRRKHVRIEHAVGCDVDPIDVTTTEGRLALTAYVWPDQAHRLERLRGALAIAQEHPPRVHRLGAGDFLDRVTLHHGVVTVLWHSVMWQYLPTAEQERLASRIEELGTLADHEAPFAHLSLEPHRTDDGDHEFQVRLRAWPDGELRVLGVAPPHGMPVTWAQPASE